MIDNVVPLGKTQRGFTRMDNELYEALIGADLSGRELRVALAVHRQTIGYNVQESRIAASYIAEMAGLHREDVSRIISELLRQRVLYRTGGSRSPIGIAPASEWKIDTKNTRKNTQSKAPQCGVSTTSKVAFLPHNKDRKDNTAPTELVAALAATPSVEQPEAETQDTPDADQPASAKAERIPYAKIVEIYNRVCGQNIPRCLTLNDKRKRNIRNCWNLEIEGGYPFRKGEFWEAYFAQCLLNKHWMGQNDTGWTADIEFVTRVEKVLKVLEAV
jgi:phage replication O-like protein O